MNNLKLKPRDYQISCRKHLFKYLKEKDGNPIIAMPQGCHAKGHLIMMSDGSLKPVETIVVGDTLMGPDSSPRTVLQLCRGQQEMRKIIPTKGDPFVVNKDHIFNLKKCREGFKYPSDEIKYENIRVSDYETRADNYKRHRHLRRASVEFKESVLLLPPYFVGLMLGDGSICGNFSFTSADEELQNYFKDICIKFGLEIRECQKLNNKAKSIYGSYKYATRSIQNPISEIFRKIGLWGKRAWEKHIPFIYKCSSKIQRLELLAGLLDTDGYLNKFKNSFEYCTVSEQLAKDIVFLSMSLGLHVSCRKRKSFLYGVEKRNRYRIYISGDVLNNIPFKRHKHIIVNNKSNKDPLCVSFKVEKLPEDDYYGFLLDGDHLYLDENFIINHNTGKAVIIADFINELYNTYNYKNRVLMLVHSKELVQQNYNKIKNLWKNSSVGIYSAGLNKRQHKEKIIFASIGSIYKKIELLKNVNTILVDESDLISEKENTMYRKLFSELEKQNGKLRIIGFTGTPWRLTSGSLLNNGIFTDIAFNGCEERAYNWFFNQGYLCPLVSKGGDVEYDLTQVGTVAGEYNKKQLGEAVSKLDITEIALSECCDEGKNRNSWIVFATSIEHADQCTEILNYNGYDCRTVHSKLKKEERDELILAFKKGELKRLTNVNVLSVGFDHPGIDFIVDLAPTQSSRLFCQRIGRGTRPVYEDGYDLETKEGRVAAIANSIKPNCLVKSFTGNFERLGFINSPVIPEKRKKGTPLVAGQPPIKMCMNILDNGERCNTYNYAKTKFCVSCGNEFTFEHKLTNEAYKGDVIQRNKKEQQLTTYDVSNVSYSKYITKEGKENLKITFSCGVERFTEFLFIGRGYENLENWMSSKYRKLTNKIFPRSVDEALLEAPNFRKITKLVINNTKDKFKIEDYY